MAQPRLNVIRHISDIVRVRSSVIFHGHRLMFGKPIEPDKAFGLQDIDRTRCLGGALQCLLTLDWTVE